MERIRVNGEGELSLPASVLRKCGLRAGTMLMVGVREDGAIVLRPRDRFPVEIYDEARRSEFARADAATAKERASVSKALRKS